MINLNTHQSQLTHSKVTAPINTDSKATIKHMYAPRQQSNNTHYTQRMINLNTHQSQLTNSQGDSTNKHQLEGNSQTIHTLHKE